MVLYGPKVAGCLATGLGGTFTSFSTGVNLGPIGFTNP